MVSNFERFLREIQREANLAAPAHGLKPEGVVKLIMSIVDIEDQNRTKANPRINQKVKGMIQDAALVRETREGV